MFLVHHVEKTHLTLGPLCVYQRYLGRIPECEFCDYLVGCRNQPVTTLGYETADLSTKHDLLLESTLGVLTGYMKTYDFSQVMDGFAVKMSSDQVRP